MATEHDQAVCIRHWDWSETSQTVSLFGRRLGLIRAIAKGSKRDKSPFSGGVELLTLGEAVLITKASGAMATLASWDLVDTRRGLRARLDRFYAGMFAADLIQHSVHDHDPHPVLFDALVETLRAIDGAWGDALALALLRFQWVVLDDTGHRPEVFASATGGEFPSGDLLGFDARAGGVVPDPGIGAGGPTAGSLWRVRRETIETLQRVADGSENPGEPAAIERAGRLLAAYLREQLGALPVTAVRVYPELESDPDVACSREVGPTGRR